MGKTFNNGIEVASGFNVSTGRPLDDKSIVTSMTDLTTENSILTAYLYKFMEIIVEETGLKYRLIVDPTSPDFERSLEDNWAAVLTSSSHNSVKTFGAVGDGITDDTEAIRTAIEASKIQGSPVYFPAGYYFITGQLPFYTGMKWFGDGMPDQLYIESPVLSVTSLSGNNMFLELDPLDPALSNIQRPADLVRVDNSEDDGNNGTFELVSVTLPISGQTPGITIINPDGGEDLTAGTSLVTTPTGGGSNIILFNLETNQLINNVQFIDADNVRAAVIEDLGFLGQGIDQSYGGGIRFRRITTPGGRSRAMSGYALKRVFINNVPQDAIRIDQPINSVFEQVIIKKAVGDGLKFKASAEKGVNTSTKIDSCYFQNCRCAIYTDTMAYDVITNTVIEGAKIGVFTTQGRGTTINSLASETLKYNQNGSGAGIMFLSVSSFGNTINSMTDYYNTEKGQFTRGMMQFIDPTRRSDVPAATINSSYIHESISDAVTIVGTQWDGTTGIAFLDVSASRDYVPALTSGSQFDVEGYWGLDRLIYISNLKQNASWSNNRFFTTQVPTRNNFSGSNSYKGNGKPTVDDDSTKGFVAWSNTAIKAQWEDVDDPVRETSRWYCIDDTPGAARWIQNEHLYTIKFNVRQARSVGKIGQPVTEPGTEAKMIKVGRNFGFDIATALGSRVLETRLDAGVYTYKLDVFDRLPSNFLVKVIDDEGSYLTESFIRRCQYKEYNGEKYVELLLIDNSIPISTGSDYEDYTGGSVTTFELGYEEQFFVKYVKNNGGDLSFLIEAKEFAAPGSNFSPRNCNMKEFNGDFIISTSTAEISSLNSNIPCIQVTTRKIKDNYLNNSLSASIDSGYAFGDFMANHAVSSNITLTDFNGAVILDPEDAISISPARSGRAQLNSGQSFFTVYLPSASSYTYKFNSVEFPDNVYQIVKQTDHLIIVKTKFKGGIVSWEATPNKLIGFDRLRNREIDQIVTGKVVNPSQVIGNAPAINSLLYVPYNQSSYAGLTFAEAIGYDGFFYQGNMYLSYLDSPRLNQTISPESCFKSKFTKGIKPLNDLLYSFSVEGALDGDGVVEAQSSESTTEFNSTDKGTIESGYLKLGISALTVDTPIGTINVNELEGYNTIIIDGYAAMIFSQMGGSLPPGMPMPTIAPTEKLYFKDIILSDGAFTVDYTITTATGYGTVEISILDPMNNIFLMIQSVGDVLFPLSSLGDPITGEQYLDLENYNNLLCRSTSSFKPEDSTFFNPNVAEPRKLLTGSMTEQLTTAERYSLRSELPSGTQVFDTDLNNNFILLNEFWYSSATRVISLTDPVPYTLNEDDCGGIISVDNAPIINFPETGLQPDFNVVFKVVGENSLSILRPGNSIDFWQEEGEGAPNAITAEKGETIAIYRGKINGVEYYIVSR